MKKISRKGIARRRVSTRRLRGKGLAGKSVAGIAPRGQVNDHVECRCDGNPGGCGCIQVCYCIPEDAGSIISRGITKVTRGRGRLMGARARMKILK